MSQTDNALIVLIGSIAMLVSATVELDVYMLQSEVTVVDVSLTNMPAQVGSTCGVAPEAIVIGPSDGIPTTSDPEEISCLVVIVLVTV